MTAAPGPIEQAVLDDLARGEALGAFDGALAALALRLAQECDTGPTAALAQRLRETLGALAENRQTHKQKETADFIASLSATYEPPVYPVQP